jgi:hypothetical protein
VLLELCEPCPGERVLRRRFEGGQLWWLGEVPARHGPHEASEWVERAGSCAEESGHGGGSGKSYYSMYMCSQFGYGQEQARPI